MSKTVCIRLTEAQHEELVRRSAGKNVSLYVREQLLLDVAEHDPFAELQAELERKAERLVAAYEQIEQLDSRLRRLEALAEGSDY